MWNDSHIPMAVLFTFRCYGTWLHGDERGSTDRFQNIYGTPHIAADSEKEQRKKRLMNHEEVKLTPSMRDAVVLGIKKLCRDRNWRIQAINVRTNHVHVVISIGAYDPGRALAAIKAFSTRSMRESGCREHEHSPWSEKGSKRMLWTEAQVNEANYYVTDRQGGALE